MFKCPACDKEIPSDSKFCKECGYDFSGGTQTGQLDRDTVLENRYIIVKTLGQGGMGAVYMALDSRLNNAPVAIKEMSTRAVGGDLQAAIAAFKKEAAILIGLRHHALPVVRDFFAKGEDRWYLVMDFVEGQTLAEVAHSRGPIPEAEVLDWARQLCEILDFLHKQNPPIIFRDLKPANIMLTPQGQIKLIDFGIARHFRQGSTADTTAYGSHGFAPPEQYGENQTSPSSDIYALGATLHYLLTGLDPGKNPFLFGPPSKMVKVSPRFETAIMKALELRAEDRPNDMREMLALLPGGSENSAGNNVGKKTNQSAKSKNSAANNYIPAQELKTAPISTPVDIDMAEEKTASIAGGAESNTIPMDFEQIQASKIGNKASNSVSSVGSQPGNKPNKTRNIIIAICLLITMISGGIYAYINSNTKSDVQSITQSEKQSNPIVFHDVALEQAVREVIHKPNGTIYQSDVKNIRKLDLGNRDISDISALKNFTSIQVLVLSNNKISDLNALSGLTNLQKLYLDYNKITDISALNGMTKLTNLMLVSNEISDISALSGLTKLTNLYLQNNKIVDISPLRELTALEDLNLNYNQVNDISALSGMKNLTYLSLGNNKISNISAVSELTNLWVLLLWGNQISDISAVSELTNLNNLHLNYNQISNIDALSDLKNLYTLMLAGNQISDYSPVESYYGNLTDKDFEL